MTTLIDDFSSGLYDITTYSGVVDSCQTGAMLGNGRSTRLIIADNPHNQPAHLDIAGGFLNLSVGARQYLRFEIGYPYEPDGTAIGRPLSFIDLGQGNFQALGSAFRTTFCFSDLIPINYNMIVFTASGSASYGENISPNPYAPAHFDFPFSKFTGPGASDFGRVRSVVFIFQTWADFVIDSIEIV